MSKLMELRQRKADLTAEGAALFTAATGRVMTDAEKARDDAIEAELKALGDEITRAERQQERERVMGTVADLNASTALKTPAQAKQDTEKFGSFGEFLQAVTLAARPGLNAESWDRRLVGRYTPPSASYTPSASASGSNSSAPSEGGFLVDTDHSNTLLEKAHELGEILSRVTPIPLSANSNGIKIPGVDETSRATGSRWGGVRVYRADEADTVTGSKPKFREIELKLKKLFGLWYITDELMADARALEAVGNKAFSEEITFVTENEIVNGNGSGQMLGWLNSGAVISVAAESGQAAATIVTANILSMWSRLPMRSRRNAVWYINQDVEKQLYGLTLGTGTAVVLLYTPPGINGNNSNYGLLMGRPVIPIEQAATLGTVGDIQLVDPTEYVTIDKDGLQTAGSMHVRFVYDEMTFRFIVRNDGQPAWNKPLTPFNGTATLSPFVALATR